MAAFLLIDIFFLGNTRITERNSAVLSAIIAAGALTWSLFFKAAQDREENSEILKKIESDMEEMKSLFQDQGSSASGSKK